MRNRAYEKNYSAGRTSRTQHETPMFHSGANNKPTGRLPDDQYIVEEAFTHGDVDWNANTAISPTTFRVLKSLAQTHLAQQGSTTTNVQLGHSHEHSLHIRLRSDREEHIEMAATMFAKAPAWAGQKRNPELEFTVASDLDISEHVEALGLRSKYFIGINLSERQVVIIGTRYFGEIKKAALKVAQWAFNEMGILTLHCGYLEHQGAVSYIAGLSGAGKSTLILAMLAEQAQFGADDSTIVDARDAKRVVTSNMEGGSYAKVDNVRPFDHPRATARHRLIHEACSHPGAIAENVPRGSDGGLLLGDTSLTQNPRVAIPLEAFGETAEISTGVPKHFICLVPDRTGILPGISKLTPEELLMWFTLGPSTRMGGIVEGCNEPETVFSTCFGAAFLPLRPHHYTHLLYKLTRDHKMTGWIVNTGNHDEHGTRYPEESSIAMVKAIITGELDSVPVEHHPHLPLRSPTHIPSCKNTTKILQPRHSWSCQEEYRHACHIFWDKLIAERKKHDSNPLSHLWL